MPLYIFSSLLLLLHALLHQFLYSIHHSLSSLLFSTTSLPHLHHLIFLFHNAHHFLFFFSSITPGTPSTVYLPHPPCPVTPFLCSVQFLQHTSTLIPPFYPHFLSCFFLFCTIFPIHVSNSLSIPSSTPHRFFFSLLYTMLPTHIFTIYSFSILSIIPDIFSFFLFAIFGTERIHPSPYSHRIRGEAMSWLCESLGILNVEKATRGDKAGKKKGRAGENEREIQPGPRTATFSREDESGTKNRQTRGVVV